jgi:membrane protease YdiL (CAAX protease family)
MKVVFTIFAVLLASAFLLTANKLLPSVDLELNSNTFINALLKYQVFALVLAIVVLFITIKVTPDSQNLLRVGNLSTIAQKERWLGINGKTSWKSNGMQLLVFISLATGIFMFLAVKYTDSLGNFKGYFIPLILVISITNSFSEEIIYRFAINGNLINDTSKIIVLLISAMLFGLPHYLGYPNGIIGVLMAGVLGYVLSKATYETQGIGIAWTIHFIQDIIIFTSLFMMNIKS